MALFALDHNFPEPIISPAAVYLKDVELAFVQDIDPQLPDLDDWELLLTLHHHELAWDGMISNDTSMLTQERELAVLGHTRLTLIAPKAAGHDPIRSTGLILAHIEHIAEQTTSVRPQVWTLGGRAGRAAHPDEHLERLGKRSGISASTLRQREMPPAEVLERDPLRGRIRGQPILTVREKAQRAANERRSPSIPANPLEP